MSKTIHEHALSGAMKICGTGQCLCNYNCGHSNRVGSVLRMIGTVTTCPLAKYNIQPEANAKPWWEMSREEREVQGKEFFALCGTCEYGEIRMVDGEECAGPKEESFMTVCIDCPVKSVWDTYQETAAEARMS